MEAHQVRKLATSTHAPADWIFHAKTILRSWEGARTTAIAAELHCHVQTVRERIPAFNERGLEGLGMVVWGWTQTPVDGSGATGNHLLALVKRLPPGKPGYERTGAFEAEDARADAPAEWTLDTLTAAARDHGIQVARSQVRCIFRREGVRWRRTHPWATSNDAVVVPKEPRSSGSPPTHPRARRSSASMHWGQ